MNEHPFEITFTGMEHTWRFGRDIGTEQLEQVIEGMSFTDSMMLAALTRMIADTCVRLRTGEG